MRVSVTTIESYRLWAEGDWMPEEELLATIRGEFKPTEKMLLGQAFGRAIEKADKYRRKDSQGNYYAVPVMTPEGWKEYIFPGAVVDPCLLHFDRRGVFEVKHVKNYGGVDVVCKADQIIGTVINENKTKLSQFDFDRYAESCQWRFMLDIFGASMAKYNVFQLSDDGQELKDTATFTLYPYPDLHKDCCDVLARFLGYVAARNLQPYLQEKE